MIEEIREVLEDNTVGDRPLCILSKPEPIIEDLPDEDWTGESVIRGIKPDRTAEIVYACKSRKGVEFKSTRGKDK